MTVLNYPEGMGYAPVGQCIYCGDDSRPDLLQREHIIPKGLNGTVVLPKASCPRCAAITAEFERVCLQKMFVDARIHLGLASRRHRRNKQPPSPLKVGHLGEDRETSHWQELSRGDHPFALCTLDFYPAGYLLGTSLAEQSMNIVVIETLSFRERFGSLPRSAFVQWYVDSKPFGRMLAKIAHSYAVAVLGINGFDPFLPGIVLGTDPNIFHYVGGAIASAEMPKTLHLLSLRKENGLVLADIRFFVALGGPAYRVVVGRES